MRLPAFSQERLARRLLEEAGYQGIGIDHFARQQDPLTSAMRNRTMHRNFQGYTVDTPPVLIGIGASSISSTPFGYAQNLPDNLGWQRRIAAGELPVARGKALDRDDRMRAEIIEAILCYFEADLEEIAGRHGHPVACLGPDLARVVDTVGSIRVQIDGWKVRLIRDSHEIARLAASCFDGYLHAGTRYSAAV